MAEGALECEELVRQKSPEADFLADVAEVLFEQLMAEADHPHELGELGARGVLEAAESGADEVDEALVGIGEVLLGKELPFEFLDSDVPLLLKRDTFGDSFLDGLLGRVDAVELLLVEKTVAGTEESELFVRHGYFLGEKMGEGGVSTARIES